MICVSMDRPALVRQSGGRGVAGDGQMVTIDLPLVVVRQNRLARALMGW